MTTQTKPLLISKDERTAYIHTQNWNKAKAGLQKVLDAYSCLVLPALTGIEDVTQLFANLPGFIYTQLTGGSVVIKGANKQPLPVTGEMGLLLVGKPDGYAALEEASKVYAKECLAGYGNNDVGRVNFLATSVKDYFILTDGILDFADSVKEKISDAGNIYARTEKGQAYYRFFEKVTQALLEEGLLDANDRKYDNLILAEKLENIIHRYLRAIDTKTKKPIFNTPIGSLNPTPFFDR